jgi:hypothetical protein
MVQERTARGSTREPVRTQRATPPAQPAPSERSRTRVVRVTGGVIAVLMLAFMTALMAVPSGVGSNRLEGPFVARLSQSEVQVNLAGESSKRYLVMSLLAEYSTYDQSYVTARVGSPGAGGASADPLYAAMLKDALLRVASTKSRDQVTDPVQVESFLAQLREAVDPVLFPVCVGTSRSPRDEDGRSGLKLGESGLDSTLRGLLHEHALRIDAPHRAISLDSGPPCHFTGSERDLRVSDARGQWVALDVTGLDLDFSGEVAVGAAGKVRRIFRDSFLVQ